MNNKFTTVQNPNSFVWDFWYYYEPKTRLFHLLYLNADPALVPDEKHHFSACIGYAVTRDFTEIDWIDNNVFSAQKNSWDNTSIWSGDIVKVKGGYLLYYTSRNAEIDDGFTQNIGAAFSTDFRKWEKFPNVRLRPDERFYEPHSLEGDNSIHAWRDPFLFRHEGCTYMLLTAKSKQLPLCKKGTVAILRSVGESLTNWEIQEPLVAPGWYSEMEVPQLYKDASDKYVLCFSTWAKFDSAPKCDAQGGLHGIYLDNPIRPSQNIKDVKVLLPEFSGIYAGIVIPELGGDIVGFDTKIGGLRRSGTPTGFKSLNRDFSDSNI